MHWGTPQNVSLKMSKYVENNVAYIDFNKCKMCRKCVEQCPTGAIKEENFPPRKPKTEEAAAPAKAEQPAAQPNPEKKSENQ